MFQPAEIVEPPREEATEIVVTAQPVGDYLLPIPVQFELFAPRPQGTGCYRRVPTCRE